MTTRRQKAKNKNKKSGGMKGDYHKMSAGTRTDTESSFDGVDDESRLHTRASTLEELPISQVNFYNSPILASRALGRVIKNALYSLGKFCCDNWLALLGAIVTVATFVYAPLPPLLSQVSLLESLPVMQASREVLSLLA